MQLRLIALGLLLGAEALLLSVFFDGAELRQRGGLLAFLGNWGSWGLRWGLGAAVLFVGFAYLKKQSLPETNLGPWLRPAWLLAHAVFAAAFGYLSSLINSGAEAGDPLVAVWFLLAGALAACAALALIPFEAWLEVWRLTGPLLVTSALASGLACWLGSAARLLWEPLTALTFGLVKFLLSAVLKDLVTDPGRMLLQTPRFGVIVSPECSGLEGLGLFLIFGLLWLFLFRQELRFPHATVMIPIGMICLYLLNALRIAALLLIGDAGWKSIAAKGFHSQAGWIAFNCVAFALLLGARKIQWIRKHKIEAQPEDGAYPAAPYLVPFLAILAAAILAGAVTAHFEWLYPLRLVAGLTALWLFRKRYQGVDWGFGWAGISVGFVVFVLWIAFDWLMGSGQAATGIPNELAQAPLPWRLAWLCSRIAGAVLAVPIAEELAFRGFGLRRLIAEDFEVVPWRSVTALSLGGSSLIFGFLHGGLWLAGILAGLLYGLVMIWRGRLGESIAAHATTNALLAAYVLWSGRWYLW